MQAFLTLRKRREIKMSNLNGAYMSIIFDDKTKTILFRLW